MKKFTRTLLYLAVFTLPFGMGIQSDLNFYISKIFVIFVLLFSFSYIFFFKKKKKLFFPKGLTFFFIYIIFHTTIFLLFNIELLSFDYIEKSTVYGTIDYEEGYGLKLLRLLFFLIFSYSILDFINTRKLLTVILQCFSAGFVLSVLLNIKIFINELIYSHLRFWGSSSNPNVIGLISLMVMLINIYIYMNESKRGKRYYHLLLFILISGFVLILSGSRSAILGSIAGLLFIILKSNKKLKIYSIVFIIIITAPAIIPETILSYLVLRSSKEYIVETKGSSRLDIWGAYLKNFDKYIITGLGYSNSPKAIRGTIQEGRTLHNTYFSILVEFGILGFAFILQGIFQIIRKLNKINDTGKVYILAILYALLVNSFFIDNINQRITWLIFPVIISYINFSKLNEA